MNWVCRQPMNTNRLSREPTHERELTEAERDALAKQAREYRMGLCTCILPVPVRRADQRPDRCLCCGGIIPRPSGAG